MGPAGVNPAQGHGMSLLLALQFALHYEAVRIVGKRTGLEANDVLTLCGPHDADGVGRDHPLLEIVEVPEHEVASGARITHPVARDVDVGHFLPRKACAPHMHNAVVECLVVPTPGGVVDGHSVHPVQSRDGELELLALWRLGTPYRLYDPLRDTPVELLLEFFGDPAAYPVGALGRGRRTSGQQGIPKEAESGKRE